MPLRSMHMLMFRKNVKCFILWLNAFWLSHADHTCEQRQEPLKGSIHALLITKACSILTLLNSKYKCFFSELWYCSIGSQSVSHAALHCLWFLSGPVNMIRCSQLASWTVCKKASQEEGCVCCVWWSHYQRLCQRYCTWNLKWIFFSGFFFLSLAFLWLLTHFLGCIQG